MEGLDVLPGVSQAMNLDQLNLVVGWLAGVFALVNLLIIIIGVWQGIRRAAGTTMGISPGLLRSPLVYIVSSGIFICACYLFWRPLPLTLQPGLRVLALVIGSLLYFPGMALVLWGRLVLGRMYFVSTGFGAQLFADHRLITQGPYSIVRHPMYAGLSIAIVGGLFLYQTWTMVMLLILPIGLSIRARREEQVLAFEFGDEWQQYCKRVPAWIPHLWRRN